MNRASVYRERCFFHDLSERRVGVRGTSDVLGARGELDRDRRLCDQVAGAWPEDEWRTAGLEVTVDFGERAATTPAPVFAFTARVA